MNDLVKPHLADVLIELCETHDLSSITVAQIIEAAHVSRRTFYNHFSGIFELVGYASTRPLLTGKEPFASIENHVRYYEEAKKHPGFFAQIPSYAGIKNFQQVYTDWVRNNYRAFFVDENLPERERVYNLSLIDIFVVGAVNFSFEWMAGGMKLDPEDLVSIIFDAAPDFVRARVSHTPTKVDTPNFSCK